jgi:hypothetical protein
MVMEEHVRLVEKECEGGETEFVVELDLVHERFFDLVNVAVSDSV